MTTASIEMVNRVVQRWIAFQREAISQVNGRLRSIVGDNLVTTYHSADHAVDALLRLETLVNAHNDAPGDLPTFAYTAVICRGDLFVLNVGVHGPLVAHTFRLLDQVEIGCKVIEEAVYVNLQQYKDRFAQRTGAEGRILYYLMP
jgi:hypothetical protein